MPQLEEATFTISPDEHAWSLKELNLPTPDSKGRRRFQMIEVVRGDKLVTWASDMGDAKSFDVDQIHIMGGFVDERGKGHCYHSVAELQEMADDMRAGNMTTVVEVDEQTGDDWLQKYMDEADRRKMVAEKRSTFGGSFRKMRY